jgi:hypothetical protein
MYNLQTINNDVNNVNVNVNNNNIILSYNIGNVNDNLFNSYLEIITVEEYTTPIYDDTDDFEEDDTDDDTDDDSIS